MKTNDTIKYYKEITLALGYNEYSTNDGEINDLVLMCQEARLSDDKERMKFISEEICLRLFYVIENAVDKMKFYKESDVEDLLQQGMEICVEAIYGYKADKGAQFKSYLTTRLMYGLKEYQIKLSTPFKLPESLTKILPQVAAVVKTIDEPLTAEMVMERLDCDNRKLVCDAISYLDAGATLSLEYNSNEEDDGTSLSDVIASDITSPVEETESEFFWDTMNVLPKMDRDIMLEKVHSEGKCGYSSKQLSTIFGVDVCVIDESLKKSKNILAREYSSWRVG